MNIIKKMFASIPTSTSGAPQSGATDNKINQIDINCPVGRGMKTKSQGLFVFLLMLITLFTGTIHADLDLEDITKMSLEEMLTIEVITAGNKQEQVWEIPASVVIIPHEEIEIFGYQSLEQILASVVGMYPIDDYQSEGINFGVRGFWKDNQNSAVVILVNGVPQLDYFAKANAFSTINVPVEAISRIEVVRGPLSVIYGSGAFLGAINIITNEMHDKKKLEGVITGTYGNRNYRLVARVAAGRPNRTRFVFNASASGDSIHRLYSEMGGSGDRSTKNDMYRDERHFSLSAAHPSGVYANLSYDEEFNGYPFLFQPVEATKNINSATSTRVNLGIRKELSPTFGFDADMFFGNAHRMYDYDTQVFPNAWEIQRTQSRFVHFNLAFFLTTPSKKLDITIGGNYTAAFDTETIYDLPQFGLSNGYEGTLDPMVTRDLYCQGKWHLSKNLVLVAGVRFEQALKYEMLVESNAGMQYVDPQDHYGYQRFEGTAFYDNEAINVIPRLAAIWTVGKGHVLKFLYGEANNLPPFFSTRDSVRDPIQESVDPETIKTYEVNYTAAPSSRVFLGFSVFYNKLNLIIRETGFDDDDVYYSRWKNTGKMSGWGLESQITYMPVHNLKLYGGFSYQEMEDQNHPDKDVSFSPRFLGYIKGALRIGKNHSIAFTGNIVGPMESLYNWSPQDQSDPQSPPIGRIGRRVPGYFNLALNVRLGNLFSTGMYANLRISNLLNTDIFYPINSSQPWAAKGTLANGRTFSLTVGWKF